MDYETLRQGADSWGLVYLVVLFVIVVAFLFRPGAGRVADEAARIPFKED
ncbi:MAG: cbb3-type cytochrome c oxidase subunit 3 [Proteobacteria bacterium]|nr:cbb3-type cytochrome c oxidase subunit 3 [Pseudomonadota bacterium]